MRNIKRICSEYDECTIPFYECTFSITGLCLPFNNFKIEILNHLMISPSQLNPVSWAYIKFFQYWCDHWVGKPYSSFFFHLFMVQCSSTNHTQGHGLITLTQVTRYFKAFFDGVKHFQDLFLLVNLINEEAHVTICSIRTGT